jgi:glycosyltransferase involved in cell wall biosynthesis
MKILFVAMLNSIHTVRWVNQLKDRGWDIHLFPVEDWGIHPDLRNVTVHNSFCRKPEGLDESVRVVNSWPFSRISGFVRRALKKIFPTIIEQKLARVIKLLNPDIIHSLEIQHAGYLTLAASKQFRKNFPKWIVTNWGSDILVFGQQPDHREKIRAVLTACNYYDCECHRDVELAKAFGFKGQVLPVLPNTGGFNIKRMQEFRSPGLPSARRLIVLKGYQGWAGRALVGLQAIELIADSLKGYHVAVYLAEKDVKIASEKITQTTGIPIDIIPHYSHDDMLRLHGRARISIGLSIGDAASTSMLEAMVMGSFPIQSCTACANEWITDGISGMIVPPEDPENIAEAIRRAISDDALVDRAAEINTQTALERLNYSSIQQQVILMYEKVAQGRLEQEVDEGHSQFN